MTSQPRTLSLKSLIAGKRQEYLAVLRELLAASADGEEALQRAIAQRFEGLGCQVESISSRPNRFVLPADFAAPSAVPEIERVSVVAVLPGTGGGRSLLTFAHPDSEPVVDTDQ